MKTFRRILITQTKEQADQFDMLMNRFGQSSKSALVAILVATKLKKNEKEYLKNRR